MGLGDAFHPHRIEAEGGQRIGERWDIRGGLQLELEAVLPVTITSVEYEHVDPGLTIGETILTPFKENLNGFPTGGCGRVEDFGWYWIPAEGTTIYPGVNYSLMVEFRSDDLPVREQLWIDGVTIHYKRGVKRGSQTFDARFGVRPPAPRSRGGEGCTPGLRSSPAYRILGPTFTQEEIHAMWEVIAAFRERCPTSRFRIEPPRRETMRQLRRCPCPSSTPTPTTTERE